MDLSSYNKPHESIVCVVDIWTLQAPKNPRGEDLGSYGGMLNSICFEKQCGHNNNLVLYTIYITS